MTTEQEHVRYQPQRSAPVPQGADLMVDTGDWTRVRKNVERLGEPLTDHANTWASAAFGAAVGLATTALTLLLTDTKAQPGLIPILWVATGFAILFGVCFFLVGRTEKDRRSVSVDAVCEDMDDVAERAGRPELRAPLKDN